MFYASFHSFVICTGHFRLRPLILKPGKSGQMQIRQNKLNMWGAKATKAKVSYQSSLFLELILYLLGMLGDELLCHLLG